MVLINCFYHLVFRLSLTNSRDLSRLSSINRGSLPSHLSIALFCKTSGHIYSLLPLGKELQKRGHKVTCFLTLDGEEMVHWTK